MCLSFSVTRTVTEFNKTHSRGAYRFSVTYTFAFVPGDTFSTSVMQVKLIYLEVAFEATKQLMVWWAAVTGHPSMLKRTFIGALFA